jgi:hypothetical protein
MKAWLANLRISLALDSSQRPAAQEQRRQHDPAELRGFEQDMTALDRGLKQTVPSPHAPPSLHGSIMRAVRTAERPAAESRRELVFLRWLPWSVAAVLVVMAVWYVARGPERLPARDAQSLAVATSAFEMGGQVARAVPTAVVSPLADELEKVNRDLNSTAQFLLASLP